MRYENKSFNVQDKKKDIDAFKEITKILTYKENPPVGKGKS